ncbi:Protein bir1 [Trichoderma ghanense]|uniref:Protein bir1 n=1 Tax=Trichoderma ghanense TaxID=65468 RepID=A0ABY2H063_9HYPO
MAAEFDQYFTYEARLASFQKTTKKRGSTTGGRAAKALNWPHKQISITSLARAGFVFRPSPESPDNTVCFLCEKGLDGWEAGDDPVYEHVKHAPHCGWAIVAAIEADIGDYGREDPNDPDMIDARRATFADRWPHENKKGWKCKTKQLVEAGWKYTPTEESDDMATCTYCQLALDGWEQGDKPLDEHYNRSPDCPFFALVSQYRALGKGSGRARSARNSASSLQSYGTAAADVSNASDVSAGLDDSVVTTASSASQLGIKKARAKKGAAAKAGRKKMKKDEQSEALDQDSQMEEPRPPKVRRGKKRPSDAVEELATSSGDGPLSKKRSAQALGHDTIDDLAAHDDDSEMTDVSRASYSTNTAPSRPKAGRKVASKLKSHASMASLRAPGKFPDDDEIERQLEVDLERQITDDEIAHHSDSGRIKAKAKAGTDSETEAVRPAKPKSPEYAMFDPVVPEPSEDEIDDDLKALKAEMQVEEPFQVPKKGRKAGARKGTKQAKAQNAKSESLPQEREAESEIPESQQEEDVLASADVSENSTGSVLRKSAPAAPGKRGRGRPKASLASQDESVDTEATESSQQSLKRGPGRPARVSLASLLSAEPDGAHPAEPPAKRGRGRPSNASLASLDSTGADEEIEAAPAPAVKRRGRPSKTTAPPLLPRPFDVAKKTKEGAAAGKRGRGRPAKKPVEMQPAEPAETEPEDDLVEARELPEVPVRLPKQSPVRAIFSPKGKGSLAPLPGTPSKLSPAPSARQPVLSPSQSPQSSDAENQPPASRALRGSAAKRLVLAPVASTPAPGSPSKRNVMAGLRSTMPWASASLEAIFESPLGSPSKENEVDRFLTRGNELTSPERQMTVEEWIYFNAAEAEKKLKFECESLVNRFEMEGTRAIKVLEGLEVESAS